MSSDSSDDENLAKLREATDSQFITDDMYKKKPKNDKEPVKLPPSLRYNKNEDDEQFNLFKVTPEFRNYVAKHLTSILDKILNEKLTNKIVNNNNYPHSNRKIGGIKLLKTSKKRIKLDWEPEISVLKRKCEIEKEIDENQLKNVAINLDFIKNEVKHWSNRSKAPIYRYKKTTNGKLIEIP